MQLRHTVITGAFLTSEFVIIPDDRAGGEAKEA